MKKFAALLSACLLTIPCALAEENAPEKNIVALENGAVEVYDFGENKLHAYLSGDALNDVCYAVESPEGMVLIESTAFDACNDEWKEYVDSLGKDVAGELMAYHPNGAHAHQEETIYATENAQDNWAEGGSIRALTDGFVVAFGDSVATDMPEDVATVNFGDKVTLAGMDFVVRNENDDAYGIEIPAINCVYIHMMGSHTHNILTSVAQIEAFKAELEGFDYALVLTSHNAPEGQDAVTEKIAYLEKTAELAQTCQDAASFTEAMNQAFPTYDGANYLEMTAGALFPAE